MILLRLAKAKRAWQWRVRLLPKIARLRTELDKGNLAAELEVDGGIKAEIAPRVVSAGARVLVAGAAVFNSGQTIEEALRKIRTSLL